MYFETFFGELLDTGGRNGTPLSSATVAYTRRILRKSMKYAVEVEGIIPNNPVARVALPKGNNNQQPNIRRASGGVIHVLSAPRGMKLGTGK